jgi:hypothetical protein
MAEPFAAIKPARLQIPRVEEERALSTWAGHVCDLILEQPTKASRATAAPHLV